MDPSGTGVPVEPGKLFIGGLSWETQEKELKAHFEKYGEVSDCVIMRDPSQPPHLKKHRGFGFVTFKDPSVVGSVLSAPREEHVLDNKKIDPKLATIKNAAPPGMSQGPTKKIFVGGVASGTTEDDVKEYFSKFGNVTEVDLKIDKATQRMRGFGFVGFDSEEVAEKLVQMHYHQINGKTVEVKKAEPRYATSQQPRGMGGMNQMGGPHGYQQPYQTQADYNRGDFRGGATNGAQYGQQFNFGGGSNYGYSSYGQGMPPQASGGYGNYGYPSGQYGGYYDQAAYSRSQGGSGESRGMESSYPNYGYGQQQMTSYPQNSSTYSATRSSYATAHEGYGQQTGPYTGEYSRGGNQQQRGYPAAPPYR